MAWTGLGARPLPRRFRRHDGRNSTWNRLKEKTKKQQPAMPNSPTTLRCLPGPPRFARPGTRQASLSRPRASLRCGLHHLRVPIGAGHGHTAAAVVGLDEEHVVQVVDVGLETVHGAGKVKAVGAPGG